MMQAVIDTLGTRIDHAVSSLGVLLVLVTLFAAEQARLLGDETSRTGGSRARVLALVTAVSASICVVTVSGIWALKGLASDAWAGRDTETSAIVLVLIWILLFPLAVWEVATAIEGGWRLARKFRP